MKAIKTLSSLAILACLCSCGQNDAEKTVVNDMNTPLHLLQPDYNVPYGVPTKEEVKEEIAETVEEIKETVEEVTEE